MSGMSKIVKTISCIAFPFIMIYGLYVIAHGHLTPGGGFPTVDTFTASSPTALSAGV